MLVDGQNLNDVEGSAKPEEARRRRAQAEPELEERPEDSIETAASSSDADLEEERGGRGGRGGHGGHGGRAGHRRAPSSPPSMAGGGADGEEDDTKTQFWKSKIKG
jgi:hypothetical protein